MNLPLVSEFAYPREFGSSTSYEDHLPFCVLSGARIGCNHDCSSRKDMNEFSKAAKLRVSEFGCFV